MDGLAARRTRPAGYLLASLILLLGASLRFYRIGAQSLWADEGNSAALAHASFAQIAQRTAADIHPPLYYWLLHAWVALFGDGEAALRGLSAVMGVILIAVVYAIGRELAGENAGLGAALAVAVSPFQVYYSQEARMYMLLSLCGGVTALAALKLFAGRNRLAWGAAYVLGAACGMYTHYAFPVVLLAANAAALLWLRESRPAWRRGAVLWAALQVVPVLLYLPWLPTAWQQVTTWPAPSSAVGPAEAVREVLFHLAHGPTYEPVSAAFWLALALGGAVALCLPYAPRGRVRVGAANRVLVLLCLLLPVCLSLALFRPAYLKFLVVAGPALACLIGLLISNLLSGGLRWAGGAAAAFLVVTAAPTLGRYYYDPHYARDDYRRIAAYVEAVAADDDAVLLNAPGQGEVFGYYYRGDSPVYLLPRQRPPEKADLERSLREMLEKSRRVYAVYWATDESDPEGWTEAYLEANAFKATDIWYGPGGVRLVTYAAPPRGEGTYHEAAVEFDKGITLAGYELFGDSVAAGDVLDVRLHWKASAKEPARVEGSYTVFLQVLDGANHIVGQRDAPPRIPTDEWEPGETVVDNHGVLVEPGTPPGGHTLVVGLYDASTGARLPVVGGADYVPLAPVEVTRPPSPFPLEAFGMRRETAASFGPLLLVGYDAYKTGHSYDPDIPIRPGDSVHIVLYWQKSGPGGGREVRLTAVERGGRECGAVVAPTAGVAYDPDGWASGEIVRAQFDMFTSPDCPSGRGYDLSVQVVGVSYGPVVVGTLPTVE